MNAVPELSRNAYAKINLTLDITGKQPDGYHTICSVFQSITLCDRISLAPNPGGDIQVTSSRLDLPCDATNTVWRAAQAFFTSAGVKNPGIAFSMEKQIPWQAGLGGGSADAAAALLLLNQSFQTNLSRDRLFQIGLKVGADVPFCLLQGTALAEGIGEQLTPLKSMPPCFIVLCKPKVGICTKDAYSAIDSGRTPAADFTPRMLKALETGNLISVAECVGNRFEQIALPAEVTEIKRHMLRAGAAGACMTGSGSAVFGLFQQMEQAETCRDQLLLHYTDVFLCEPFQPHP